LGIKAGSHNLPYNFHAMRDKTIQEMQPSVEPCQKYSVMKLQCQRSKIIWNTFVLTLMRDICIWIEKSIKIAIPILVKGNNMCHVKTKIFV